MPRNLLAEKELNTLEKPINEILSGVIGADMITIKEQEAAIDAATAKLLNLFTSYLKDRSG